MIMKKAILTAAALTCGLALGTTSYAAWGHKDMSSSSSMDRSMSASDRSTSASVDNLKGMRVLDRSGEDIGTVRDVLFDRQTGKIDYLILASGISGAEKRYAIPFDSVQFKRDENLLTLNMDRDRLYSFAASDQYYGVSPSSSSSARDKTVVVPESTATKTNLENLRGMRVEDRAGHDFGTVKDLGFDPSSGMISHMVITSNNRDYLVPIRDMLYRPDRNLFSLSSDVALLSGVSPEFYGVSPATTYRDSGTTYRDSGLRLENQNSGLSYQNLTGQPRDRWDLGSSDAGREFPAPEGYYVQEPATTGQ